MNSIVKPLAVVAVAASALILGVPAHATAITYSLNKYIGSGTAGPGPYGTLELNDNGGANVTVTVTLTSGEGFVNTGAGASLFWDLFGAAPQSALTITNTDGTKFGTGATTGFGFDVNGTGIGNAGTGGSGKWDYGIFCDSACGNGGNAPFTGALSFTIDSITLSDFVANNKGYLFASDICTSVNTTTDKCNPQGLTGDIVGGPQIANVPEPATLALFAAGLGGLGFALGRRRKTS